MHELLKQLTASGPAITDGAWGTQLYARGLEPGACADAWNLEHPDRVEGVARAYVEAGSDVILTNTFGANRFMLARHGLEDKVAELNRAGVEISRRAAGAAAKVFASIGPTGVMLMMGDVPPEQVQEAFAVQARAMAEAGADAIVIETMADPAEAALAVKAAKTTGLPVVACMVFDSGKDLDRTMMGTTPEQAVDALTAAGADMVGSNCGQGIDGFLSICRRLQSAAAAPVWIKANAGLPEVIDGRTVYAQTPEKFAAAAAKLVESGAGFVGGCCGTSPEFIRAVSKALRG